MPKPCIFNRNSYLLHASKFENLSISEGDIELKEFDYNPKDLAKELAYTRYLLAKAEKELGRKLELTANNESGEEGRDSAEAEISDGNVSMKVTTKEGNVEWEWKNIENIKLSFNRESWHPHPYSGFTFEEFKELAPKATYIVIEFFEPNP